MLSNEENLQLQHSATDRGQVAKRSAKMSKVKQESLSASKLSNYILRWLTKHKTSPEEKTNLLHHMSFVQY